MKPPNVGEIVYALLPFTDGKKISYHVETFLFLLADRDTCALVTYGHFIGGNSIQFFDRGHVYTDKETAENAARKLEEQA